MECICRLYVCAQASTVPFVVLYAVPYAKPNMQSTGARIFWGCEPQQPTYLPKPAAWQSYYFCLQMGLSDLIANQLSRKLRSSMCHMRGSSVLLDSSVKYSI